MARLVGVGRDASCQAKVADFELAVGIHQQIAWLQIAMEDIGGVDVLQTAKDLVDEGLEMSIGKGLTRSDKTAAVSSRPGMVCRG